MLERETQWGRLLEAWQCCVDGRTAVVLVEGAAGCGTTQLLRRLTRHAADHGAHILHAQTAPGSPQPPHGVLRRLLHALPAELRPPHGTPGRCGPEEFTAAVRTLAARAPVVVCVDDLQDCDPPSLAHLVHLSRSPHRAPVLLALGQVLGVRGPHAPAAGAPFLHHEEFRRIRVGRLSPRGTALAAMSATGTGTGPVPVAPRLYELTGGNPLLCKALLDEEPTARGEGGGPGPAPDGPFLQAAAACLRRSGPAAGRLAQALAVLGPDANAERVARTAGISPRTAAHARDVLDAAGLVTRWHLRHPAVAAAVLAAPAPHALSALYAQAAHILHTDGAPAAATARRLLLAHTPAHGAGRPGAAQADGWAVAVLVEAARQALVEDDSAAAVDCLRLARHLSAPGPGRCTLDLRLAELVRRTDPARAERQLAAPLQALARGELGYADAALLGRTLLAQGRIEQAGAALEHAERRRAAGERGEDPLRGLLPLAPAACADSRGGPAPAAGPLRAATALLWPPAPAGRDEAAVDRVLKNTPLTHRTLDLVLREIRTLVHADHNDRALVWCQKLQAEADRERAPGWFAALGLLHAQALLRLGDPRGARQAAAAAAEAVEDRGGLVLSALAAVEIAAYTATGEYDAAARRLEPPLPDALFDSVHALDQLRARGHYYLATHRHAAALAEFLDAGRLARRWGLDHPRHLPWRTDAAGALLHLGERERAARLIAEQCDLPTGRDPRPQGAALRLRAALAPLAERPGLLTRALEELRRCGDRLEHAHVLADLADALQLADEGNRAGILARRAWHLAADCGARALCERIRPGRTDLRTAAAAGPAPSAAGAARLTEPEQRVAALAAFGYTNREISAKLYVTTSTIEQHLTKIYRKLGISRRSQLPLDLEYDVP
ncbi:LuxR family transcriptional regulator [Streptomyces sp. KL118A]|uniref:LuxR family transcriptional regulator n=1 Tax=Streptomyces sp. KL118A TaxID=3045153 RepID=UPI00278C1332|nr:LuxR family transcriptional regulator [Streptomyces sp. KL118A]